MKTATLLSFLALAVFLLPACKKAGNVAAVSITPKDTTKNHTDSMAQLSIYPYCDTFYGPYQEYSYDISPNNVSGFSRVYVWHLSSDAIEIKADTIGIGRPSQYMTSKDTLANTNKIDVYMQPMIDSSFSASVRWWNDRGDYYTCIFHRDSICCNFDQEGGACVTDYIGTYTGYIKKQR